jgi:fatty acid desaturase
MQPPDPTQLRALKPFNSYAWLLVAVNWLLVGGGLWLSASGFHPLAYIAGQVLLALGFTQALVLLHEAGHRTLFRQPWLNDLVGTLAGFVALIPYASWRPIHARHHQWTGWQDLDATTATLVPRRLAGWECVIIDGAWRYWVPLFSVLYRLQNYWHIKRVTTYLPMTVRPASLWLAAGLQLLAYVALISWFGLYQTLATNLSKGESVRPFPPIEQEPFTRSLRLPRWLSWLLLHFDAHELHHLYPAVPGYLLRRISYSPSNEVPWLTWIHDVKRMSGTRFLFGESDIAKGRE